MDVGVLLMPQFAAHVMATASSGFFSFPAGKEGGWGLPLKCTFHIFPAHLKFSICLPYQGVSFAAGLGFLVFGSILFTWTETPSTSLGGRMRDIKGSHPVSQDEGSTSLLLTPQSALHWKMQP